MAHPLEILLVDARQTAGRIVSDARRMRDIGRRAVVGARIAGARARAQLDRGLEQVADAILEFEARMGNGRRE